MLSSVKFWCTTLFLTLSLNSSFSEHISCSKTEFKLHDKMLLSPASFLNQQGNHLPPFYDSPKITDADSLIRNISEHHDLTVTYNRGRKLFQDPVKDDAISLENFLEKDDLRYYPIRVKLVANLARFGLLMTHLMNQTGCLIDQLDAQHVFIHGLFINKRDGSIDWSNVSFSLSDHARNQMTQFLPGSNNPVTSTQMITDNRDAWLTLIFNILGKAPADFSHHFEQYVLLFELLASEACTLEKAVENLNDILILQLDTYYSFSLSNFLNNRDKIEPLGAGGLGNVYPIDYFGPKVVKVLHTARMNHPYAVESFLHEAETMLAISGMGPFPRVFPIKGTLVQKTGDNHLYYLMEQIEGQTLQDFYPVYFSLDKVQQLRFITQLARFLIYSINAMKSANLVHRDLKPANIMIRSFDTDNIEATEFVLLDFGTTREINAERESVMSGTPLYMDPRTLSESPSVWHELYSVSVILSQFLSDKAQALLFDLVYEQNIEKLFKVKKSLQSPEIFKDLLKICHIPDNSKDSMAHFFYSTMNYGQDRITSPDEYLTLFTECLAEVYAEVIHDINPATPQFNNNEPIPVNTSQPQHVTLIPAHPQTLSYGQKYIDPPAKTEIFEISA